MKKYTSRLTSSARGEAFNPLVWPFLIATFSYAIGFVAFSGTDAVHSSSLFIAMSAIGTSIPFVWGAIALMTIVVGLTFLLFNIPPAGKISGLVGFMLWLFAAFCWGLTGAFLPVFAIAVPNVWFWFWQYLSLSHFGAEDAKDARTMRDYDTGGYDDELNPKDAKRSRESNRGVDEQ